MKKTLRNSLMMGLVLVLLLTGCQKGQGQEEAKSDQPYEAVHLGDSLFVLTKVPEEAKDMVNTPLIINIQEAPDLQVGDAIGLNFDVVLSSFPGQVNVERVEKLEGEAKTYLAGFNLSNDLLQIRPDKTHLIDVRTPEEFADGHIPGSINIPVQEIESIAEIIPDQEATLLIYCRSGNRTVTAAKALKDMGYKVIFDLGGISAYEGDLETGSGQ